MRDFAFDEGDPRFRGLPGIGGEWGSVGGGSRTRSPREELLGNEGFASSGSSACTSFPPSHIHSLTIPPRRQTRGDSSHRTKRISQPKKMIPASTPKKIPLRSKMTMERVCRRTS